MTLVPSNRASYFRSDEIEIFISKDNNGTKVPTLEARRKNEVFDSKDNATLAPHKSRISCNFTFQTLIIAFICFGEATSVAEYILIDIQLYSNVRIDIILQLVGLYLLE